MGENGVTLSGGQKARLALARAAYMVRNQLPSEHTTPAAHCCRGNDPPEGVLV